MRPSEDPGVGWVLRSFLISELPGLSPCQSPELAEDFWHPEIYKCPLSLKHATSKRECVEILSCQLSFISGLRGAECPRECCARVQPASVLFLQGKKQMVVQGALGHFCNLEANVLCLRFFLFFLFRRDDTFLLPSCSHVPFDSFSLLFWWTPKGLRQVVLGNTSALSAARQGCPGVGLRDPRAPTWVGAELGTAWLYTGVWTCLSSLTQTLLYCKPGWFSIQRSISRDIYSRSRRRKVPGGPREFEGGGIMGYLSTLYIL